MSERDMQSEYLWSGRGEPDPDVAALERALAPARLRVGLDVSHLPERQAGAAHSTPPASGAGPIRFGNGRLDPSKGILYKIYKTRRSE